MSDSAINVADLTRENREALKKLPICIHCGGIHVGYCRRIKSISFQPDGQRLAEVHYWPDGAWSQENPPIVWPWELEDTSEEDAEDPEALTAETTT